MTESELKQIVIAAAEVIGLQTAISLLTSPSTSYFKVTIVAAELPDDSSSKYSSSIPGAYWHSQATSSSDAEIRD
jgi:hypothetical protein